MTPPINLFQVWSAPEFPQSNFHIVPNISEYSNHKHAASLDTSPLQSPSIIVHPLPLPPTVSMHTFSYHTSQVASMSDPSGVPLSSQSSPVAMNFANNNIVETNIPLQPIQVSTVENIQEIIPIKSKWQKGKLIGMGTFGSVFVASNRCTRLTLINYIVLAHIIFL